MRKVASKKSFDREKMYRKIMPTYYDNNEDEQTNEQEENIKEVNTDINSSVENDEDINNVDSLMNSKRIEHYISRSEKAKLINVTEKLVLEKMDAVMDKMNCCKCDRCKLDIIALTLNSLQPHYVVKTDSESEYDLNVEQEISQKVTSAVLKSALAVRKNPRH